MTREEAIKALRYERKTALHENKSAFDMAIQALEQQKVKEIQGIMEGGWTVTFEVPDTQKSDKYRKEAKRWKNKWLKSQKSGEQLYKNGFADGYEQGHKDAESKTGHWILDETDNSITCDKCGCRIWANDISNGDAHYCPNCGFRMDEPQESEDKE